ncbi:hypothetical protein SAMN05421869_12276 [Nonomuraea jiangxiensis]|uniref:Uncharacterized protein n=1 Tax=Nonomuraea jiangxiensis TaxID=633440 RepID=A0A1G9HDN8_9ACTN|nr:hypothetical protein SAMN05421869_12276 [Nonomuraea jiangxiensis]
MASLSLLIIAGALAVMAVVAVVLVLALRR